jgi:SAM-dependent methyltransferase
MGLWPKKEEPDFLERYPAPSRPWNEVYVASHRHFVGDMLDDDAMLERFRVGAALPRHYGMGLDERVVEYPWFFSRSPIGRVLDAGSTLNHEHILHRLLPRLETLHIVTLAPEPMAFPQFGISYLFSDIRALPVQDNWYDTVVALSTLDHVGMDNSMYGSHEPRAEDPDGEACRAARELCRVLRPGGRLLITLPYGRPEDLGWMRQFDDDGLGELLAALPCSSADVTIYAYSRSGWQLSNRRAACESAYRDFVADPTPVPDRAAGARAVACLEVVV